MKKTTNKIFLAVSLILCGLLFAIRLTGAKWHVVFGVLLTCMMVKHTFLRLARMRRQRAAVQIVDEVLLAALATMFVSGMLIHPLHGMFAVKLLHKLSSVVFVLAMLGHAAQHSSVCKRAKKKEDCASEVEDVS